MNKKVRSPAEIKVPAINKTITDFIRKKVLRFCDMLMSRGDICWKDNLKRQLQNAQEDAVQF